jgi:hypothetical protein
VKEQVSAATLGSYIWGVVIPLVELPCGCSFTREIDPSVRSYIWGHGGGKMLKIKSCMEMSVSENSFCRYFYIC